MAEALVMRHLQDHGDYPQGVVVDLWGSATMRTAGEDFAMAMRLDRGPTRLGSWLEPDLRLRDPRPRHPRGDRASR